MAHRGRRTAAMIREFMHGEEKIAFHLDISGDGSAVVLKDQRHEMLVQELEAGRFVILNSQGRRLARATRHRDQIWVWLDGRTFEFRVPGEDEADSAHRADAGNEVRAPMPGLLVKLFVGEGETVEQGQVVAVVEAMKMEHSLRAPKAGVVANITATVGETVDAGAVIASIEAEA
ncbi:hypothetical protein KJ815_02505 [bacterium]|nr:hypothetical protein [bacterium]